MEAETLTNLRNRIAGILEIPNDSAGWDIIRSDWPLYLVHYKEGSSITFPQLRGTVVDLEHGVSVANSYGFTPGAILGKLVPQDDSGDLSITDIYGVEHIFKSGQYSVQPGFEGVVMRVIKHGGVVWHITHKSLKPNKSHWGQSPNFLDIYKDLGGPKDEDLFPPEADYSPWCYVFILVHPSLLVGSRQDVGPGYIVHISTFHMWNGGDVEPPFPGVIDGGEAASINTVTRMPRKIAAPFIYSPPLFTLQEANDFLSSGYYEPEPVEDPKLASGEFVIIYGYNGKGDVDSMLKVNSPSYQFRYDLRNDDANLAHRFFDLAGQAHVLVMSVTDSERAFREFLEKFPPLPIYNPQDVKQRLDKGPLIHIPTVKYTLADMNTQAKRLPLIWMNFLFSLPPQQQKLALDFLELFANSKKELVNFIINNEHVDPDLVTPLDPNKIRMLNNFISTCHKRAADDTYILQAVGVRPQLNYPRSRGRGQGQSKGRKKTNARLALRKAAEVIIDTQTGTAIYALSKTVTEIKKKSGFGSTK